MLNSSQSEKNPWIVLLIIIVLSFGAIIVSQTIFSYLVSLIYLVDYSDVMQAFSQPDLFPDLKVALLTIQFLTSVSSFILVPQYFIWRFENAAFKNYLQLERTNIPALIAICFLTIAFMVVNSIFIEWNLNVRFPEGIDQVARELENKGKLLTDYFTDFDTLPYFLYSILVIAVVPAVGEELLFRGLIQKQLHKISGNVHAAVWLAAIFFSAFHFQFFGFVPRMFLGVLFGYLFIYSGNLIYPMVAHFVNNGFTLFMIYMYQNDMVSYDIENTETVPLESVGIFAIIGAALFAFFLKQINPQATTLNE